METSIIEWKTIHKHGDLWWQHLTLRKNLFVDKQNWSIPHNGQAEWDQYDTANTVYVITHENNQAIAASRLNPCNFECGGWSYMIRDACEGKLEGIPPEISQEPPTASNIWEATRFTVDPSLDDKHRNDALIRNAIDLVDAAKGKGASQLIALMPPAFIRWLSSAGLPTKRAGPTCLDGQGNRICVMAMHL